MKKRIITLSLCAALLFSSIAVMAGVVGTPFGAYNTGYASLDTSDAAHAIGETIKYSGPGSCSTAVRAIGSNEGDWLYGGSIVNYVVGAHEVLNPYRAESMHWIGNDYTSLSTGL